MGLKTLLVGLHDLSQPQSGAGLRVLQHLRTIPDCEYVQVGRSVPWHSLGILAKLRTLERQRPWRHPFVSYHFTIQSESKLRYLLAKNQFDRIILSEIWLYPYLRVVKQLAPSSKIVIDFHNSESFFQWETVRRRPFLGKAWEAFIYACVSFMEKRLVQDADEIWMCNPGDAYILQNRYFRYGGNIHIIPNAIQISDSVLPLPGDRNMAYVGQFSYFPNRNAAEELVGSLLPLLPEAMLFLIGKNPPSIREGYQSRVRVLGNVQSVRDSVRDSKVRAMALPIREGSGTRIKVLEAFALGIPVVATRKAVEGIEAKPGEHFVLADSPQDMASALRRLWSSGPSPSDEEERLRMAARRLVEKKYSWDAIRHDCSQVLEGDS